MAAADVQWQMWGTLRRKDGKLTPSSLELKEPGQTCGSWSLSGFHCYWEQSMTHCWPLQTCTGGGWERTRYASCQWKRNNGILSGCKTALTQSFWRNIQLKQGHHKPLLSLRKEKGPQLRAQPNQACYNLPMDGRWNFVWEGNSISLRLCALHHHETRCGDLANRGEGDRPYGTVGSMRGGLQRGSRAESHQIPAACAGLQGQELADMVVYGGGWLSWMPSPKSVASIDKDVGKRKTTERQHNADWESLLVALA